MPYIYIGGQGPSTPRFALGMADAKFESFVCGGSIVIIRPDVSKETADAVIQSHLLAQLAANNRFDVTDYANWYQWYARILSGLGWSTEQFSFDKFSVDKETVTVASMTKEALGGVLAANLLSEYTEAITALNEKEANSTLLDLFLSKSTAKRETDDKAKSVTHHEQHIIFQVIVAGCQDSDDSVSSMILGLFYLTLDDITSKKWMLTKIKSSEIQMFQGVQKAVLDLDIWDKAKDAVAEKLDGPVMQKETGQIK